MTIRIRLSCWWDIKSKTVKQTKYNTTLKSPEKCHIFYCNTQSVYIHLAQTTGLTTPPFLGVLSRPRRLGILAASTLSTVSRDVWVTKMAAHAELQKLGAACQTLHGCLAGVDSQKKQKAIKSARGSRCVGAGWRWR